ncbi:MAG: MarR family transcriptional regulator [Candidatus Omnitrophota bacterium]
MTKRLDEITEEVMRILPVFLRKVHAGTLQFMSMTPAQIFILMLVQEKGHCCLSDIGRELSIAPPTATGIIDRLERDNYIKRVHSQEDRRVVNVCLTKKGSTYLEQMRNEKYERVKQVIGLLTTEDQENYLRILKTFIEGLKDV